MSSPMLSCFFMLNEGRYRMEIEFDENSRWKIVIVSLVHLKFFKLVAKLLILLFSLFRLPFWNLRNATSAVTVQWIMISGNSRNQLFLVRWYLYKLNSASIQSITPMKTNSCLTCRCFVFKALFSSNLTLCPPNLLWMTTGSKCSPFNRRVTESSISIKILNMNRITSEKLLSNDNWGVNYINAKISTKNWV